MAKIIYVSFACLVTLLALLLLPVRLLFEATCVAWGITDDVSSTLLLYAGRDDRELPWRA